jgi:Leucine-rich repeat (LRR) protein
MVLCLVPTTAFAESETEETPVCTCETACTEETMNAECPICGAEGALAENCGKYVEPAAEGEESQLEGEKTQEKQDSDMPDTQSEATLAQMSGEGENGIAVQSAGVAIDNTNFPDANFRSFVASSFDEDNDNYLSDTEINAAENINCAKKGISDLTGISHFTALKSLKCFNNQLTALDVSKNTALTSLDCDYNQLTALDVSKNVALTKLHCWGNSLTKLDVSKNTALTSLDCGANQLTTLDVSKNTALTYLDCRSNQLTALDVSKNTALTDLDCRNNQLTALDVSKNTALTDLDCRNNQLTSLDISNTDMSGLDCDGNIYQIVVGNDRTFDLSTLPGNFNVAKTSDWSGGTVSGNTLTVDSDQDSVTYKYDCGKNRRRTFTLKCVKSADYTKVDEAIKKANALKKDNYKDFTAVETAVKSVVRGKSITEQSEVDAMAKAIEDAIEALQYKDADYIKVDEAIAKANALNKDDYKDFSAVESAVNAVVRGKNITEQSEVDAMAKAIEDAIAALQYKEKPKICKGGKEVKISNGAHEMRIHGKSYGTFTFAWVNDKAGWSIQNADGKYMSFDNGKLVLRDTAYVWKYDAKFYTTTEEKTSFGWGWWGRPSTKVTNWYLVGDGTDLSISKSDTNADVKLYDAMESTEHSFGKWTPAEDGKHTRTCTICGATETGDCTYENGACTVCGALDPDNASVSVSATVTKRTSGGGGWWWWNRPTTTTWEARITATGTGVDIDKVEYSDDGKHYLTGTSFTSDTEITKFYIRVTDSKGNVTNWLYENGKVTQK